MVLHQCGAAEEGLVRKEKPGTRRVREVKHSCRSFTTSETGRSKHIYDSAQTELKDCVWVHNGSGDCSALRAVRSFHADVSVKSFMK